MWWRTTLSESNDNVLDDRAAMVSYIIIEHTSVDTYSTSSPTKKKMAANQKVSDIYEASSKLAKYPFEPYWPEKKLKICITGAGGFIARYDPHQDVKMLDAEH